tara:strand:- start:615 stop:1058 length:444 start_codon:yes stop_codon:yes gene_type:complete
MLLNLFYTPLNTDYIMPYTIGNFNQIFQIQRANENGGRHFFSKGAMRGFNSRVHDVVYSGCVFVTSERNNMPYSAPQPRVYTVRVAMADGSIQTYGSVGDYATRYDAHSTAQWLGNKLKNGSMVYCSQTYDFVESQEMLDLVPSPQS